MLDSSIIIYIVITIVFGLLLLGIVSTKIKNRDLFAKAVQAELDKIIVYARLEEFLANKDAESVEKTDGFLRFVSESREWAFSYIEEVQAAIKAFDDKVGPIVNHYKESKKSLYRKQSELLSELSEAYDILMKSMPEEESKK
jgi:uncharacterized membrane-anchored protein YhcB (DUF1043 family)